MSWIGGLGKEQLDSVSNIKEKVFVGNKKYANLLEMFKYA